MTTTFCLLFDIYYATELKQFLPTAYIASSEANKLQFVEKKASFSLLENYKIAYTLEEKSALEICDLLKIENISKKYNQKNKIKKPLATLLEDPKVASVIHKYTQSKLHAFFTICKQNKLIACINLDREKPIFYQVIAFENAVLQPNLHFKKETDKIIYTLSLLDNEKKYEPFSNKTEVLLNQPNWIRLNSSIYEVSKINGNKILPFISKKTIEIPEKTTQLYFDKFLKDVLNHVEIEAEGFDFELKNKLLGCKLHLEYDFIANQYFVNPKFIYEEDTIFDWNDKKEFRSKFVIANSITIIQIKRDKKEETKWIEKLKSLGFTKDGTNLFTNSNKTSSETYQIIHYLIANKTQLEQEGFEIADFLIEQKNISKNLGKLNISYHENADWFDVKMQIVCGEFTFYMSDLLANLKEANPFYELPNGEFFMIPNEWFFDYNALIEFSVKSNTSFLLQKNQFPILEQITSGSFLPEKEMQKWDYKPSKLVKATLRNYQKDGVKWLMEHHLNELGACLADDMGLGKTLQTLTLLATVKEAAATEEPESTDLFSQTSPEKKPLKALLVAPSSLLFNWANETKKFVPSFKIMTYIGKNRTELIPYMNEYDLIVTSYSTALRDGLMLKKETFEYLILDESQYIKNKNSKIFKVLNDLNVAHKITLSGTPIENSLADLWAQMQFLNPNLLGEFPFFAYYFKFPIEKLKDEEKINELKNLIKPYVLRRTKEQVLNDLPEVEEHYFSSEMTVEQKSIYEKEKSVVRNLLLEDPNASSKISVLNSLMKLRLLANHPKLVEATQGTSGKYTDVTNYLETLVLSGKKVLIFSSFVKHLELYIDWCKEKNISFCKITGETSAGNREKAVSEFQEGNTLLFFISLKAGGVGLNLTAASYIVILDPWWNPFAENQAIARAHRIGQKNKVSVVRFISKDTIESKIVNLQQKKKDISSSIIGMDALPDDIELNELLD